MANKDPFLAALDAAVATKDAPEQAKAELLRRAFEKTAQGEPIGPEIEQQWNALPGDVSIESRMEALRLYYINHARPEPQPNRLSENPLKAHAAQPGSAYSARLEAERYRRMRQATYNDPDDGGWMK
jgi:hypothetical protein